MKRNFRKRSAISLTLAHFMLLILTMSCILAGCAGSANGSTSQTTSTDFSHQSLPTNDGWAMADGGTTGGSKAASAQVFTVTSRAQLVQALGGNNKGTNTAPKIIHVQGAINGNEDATGKPQTCTSYATNGYSLEAYLKAYDPATWGTKKVPSGPMEDARTASHQKQADNIQIFIPSNTTIIGDGTNARVVGANFMMKGVNNVIIRNIQFENASDCFPQWDPTDTSVGSWNADYDNISIVGSTHIWIDHNTFTDANQSDSKQPVYLGRPFEQHDGELDITKAADLVTVSWNSFTSHDKTMLIGSSDTATADAGKLRITIHHNQFLNVTERLPRVRFGQVHIYNNYYNQTADVSLQYILGVGISSEIFEQNNSYTLPTGFAASKVIKTFKGTAIHTEGDSVNGNSVDLVAAYNAANTPTLIETVDWTPRFHLTLDPATAIPSLVAANAGAGHALTTF